MKITIKKAKELRRGQTIYSKLLKNKDGSPQRWKVNGIVKTWKTFPNRVQVPIKRGLYEFDYLRETNVDNFFLPKEGEVE